jgi:menaquinone-specific isochorismate synthase
VSPTGTPPPALIATTTRADGIGPLLAYADSERPLAWLHRGDGMVGIGEALRLEFTGPDRMRQAATAWRRIADAASISDSVRVQGSGLVAFGTFAFSAASEAPSTLIVPRTVVGRRGSHTFVTRIRAVGEAEDTARLVPSRRFGDEFRIALGAGAETADGFVQHVEQAVERISRGDLSKVVLARELTGRIPAGADLRRVLTDLALGYPDCWTFSVDGLVGSSPETLVRVENRTVGARVLAGTASRGTNADTDQKAALALVTSSKDQDEHQFAVRSAVETLTPFTRHLATSEVPFALKLPNLWHLATDLEGGLDGDASSIDLIDAMHPTAAVAGAPRAEAVELIAELEPFDRGRYAGPVGWVDAAGDGEWAIALRCAQVDASGTVTAYAGCGIVVDSDPAAELAETRMKFRPIVEAFG